MEGWIGEWTDVRFEDVGLAEEVGDVERDLEPGFDGGFLSGVEGLAYGEDNLARLEFRGQRSLCWSATRHVGHLTTRLSSRPREAGTIRSQGCI